MALLVKQWKRINVRLVNNARNYTKYTGKPKFCFTEII